MPKTICGFLYSAENPVTFELKFNDDGMGLSLVWADTIFSDTLVKGQDGEVMATTENTINEICKYIRQVIIDKAPNRQGD